jgi:hypothetical protein
MRWTRMASDSNGDTRSKLQRAARSKAAVASRRSRGQRVGAAPFGYRILGGQLVEDVNELAVINLVRELVSDGCTLKYIAARLRSDGLFSRRKRPYSRQAVQRILRSIS